MTEKQGIDDDAVQSLVATVEQRRSGARLVRFSGVLDEHNHLDDLTEKVGAGMALINLSAVERITSTGSRDWVQWLASLVAKGTQAVLIACSPPVVAQLNRVNNFAGNATVKSFHVPYHCSTCDTDKMLLVHVTDLGAPPHKAPPCSCDGCGAAMTFIEDDSYFAFVSRLPRPKPDAKTESSPDLARGSVHSMTGEQVKAVSQPRLPSRGSRHSLSAFQLPDAMRYSEQEVTTSRPRMVAPTNERPYLIAIVALLFLTVGVLVYLLLG